MNRWAEILDHGDDPGRYTVVFSNGQIVVLNETGEQLFQRRCYNAMGVVAGISRELGVRIVKPDRRDELLKKAGLLTESGRPLPPPRKERPPDEVIARRVAYGLRRWPYPDKPTPPPAPQKYEDLDTI